MKKRKLPVLLLALILMLTGCGSRTAMRRGMEDFMAAWTSGGTDTRFIDSDGALVTGIHNSGLTDALTKKVVYTVRQAKDGVVTLEITAPDAAAMLEEAIAGMDAFDPEKFQENMEELLEEDMPTRTFTVEVQMHEAEDQWYPVLNAELVNAITGGLPEAYAAATQQLIESLMEGGNS